VGGPHRGQGPAVQRECQLIRAANREEYNAYQRQLYAKHNESRRAKRRAYYYAHLESERAGAIARKGNVSWRKRSMRRLDDRWVRWAREIGVKL
jgi:hypothetical protein